MSIAVFHPTIQTAALHFARPELSLAEIGKIFNISKQATAKRIKQGEAYFARFGKEAKEDEAALLAAANNKIAELESVIKGLRLKLVLYAATIFMLTAFKETIHKFFPNFKFKKLSAFQKKQILDHWFKFERLGGAMKDFCRAIERSPDTLRRWLELYQKYGVSGLTDKPTRPHHFSHKIPSWLKAELIALFIRFPQWTPYQYYKYIKGHPAWHYPISTKTIANIKACHAEKTKAEKDRLKKLWAFDPKMTIWTVDFTCILKTDHWKLQLLTVSDQASRFLFETALFLDTSTALVTEHLEELFIKYGRPMLIKADNGPEFRTECREHLAELGIYLLNSPVYYGQFNGAHERIHRTLKTYIDNFSRHHNLERLVTETSAFREEYNHHLPLETMDMKTPAELYYCDDQYVPKSREIVTPYIKDNELRIKFTNRHGDSARMSLPLIAKAPPI